MRESTVEKVCVKLVKEQGGIAYKFVSPGRRGVPDRLVLFPLPEELRPLVAQYMGFIEFKAPGKKPTAQQLREHKKIRALGYRVDVVDHA